MADDDSPRRAIAFGIFLALALVGAVLVLLLRPSAPPPAPAADAGEPPPPPAPEPAPLADEEPTGEVEPPPEPLASEPDDEQLRALLGELSGHPSFSKWLEHAALGRLAAVVAMIARGESPRTILGFLPVEGKFQTLRRGEREFVDPQSYSRYDALVEVFLSLDARATARLIARLKPWLDRKVREIEKPGTTFRKLLVQAMGELLEVPCVTGDVPLFTTAVVMKIDIPELEAMSEAQKHLFRMGPENVRKVQGKLRELGRALGLARELAAYRPIAFSATRAE